MRARFGVVLLAVGALGLTLPVGGCGDNDNSTATTWVDVDGSRRPGTACPPGTTEAYRAENLIVCDTCATDVDCVSGSRCVTRCGPGCEDDTGGCCPVRTCVSS